MPLSHTLSQSEESVNIRIQTPLMLSQQCQRLLHQPRISKHTPTQNLHTQIIPLFPCQFLCLDHCLRVLPRRLLVLRCYPHSLDIWRRSFKFGEESIVLAEGETGAVFEDRGGEFVCAGEGGGVEVGDLCELALVEGGVDVYEFYKSLEGPSLGDWGDCTSFC